MPYKVGVAALILFAVLVGTLRPLARRFGRAHSQSGLTRLALLSEPADDGATPRQPVVRADVHLLVPVLVSVLLIVLKTRRIAFIPFPLRRLKLPPHSTTDSSPTA